MQVQRYGSSLFNNRNAAVKSNQLGILLLEYMIAIMIALLIFSFMFEVFKGMQVSQRFIEKINIILSEAETMTALIINEVHAAGRMGCEQITQDHLLYDNANQQYHYLPPIILAPNSISVTHTDAHYLILRQDAFFKMYIDISSSLRVYEGDQLVISDCVDSELVRVAFIHHSANKVQRIYFKNPLHFAFKKNAIVSKLVVVVIKLDKNKRKGTVSLSINGNKTSISQYIDNLLFSKTGTDGIAFQFEMSIGEIKKKWYGYAKRR